MTLDLFFGLGLDALDVVGCEKISSKIAPQGYEPTSLAQPLDWLRKGDALIIRRPDLARRSLSQLVR